MCPYFSQNIIIRPTWYRSFWLAKKCVMLTVCMVTQVVQQVTVLLDVQFN